MASPLLFFYGLNKLVCVWSFKKASFDAEIPLNFCIKEKWGVLTGATAAVRSAVEKCSAGGCVRARPLGRTSVSHFPRRLLASIPPHLCLEAVQAVLVVLERRVQCRKQDVLVQSTFLTHIRVPRGSCTGSE